jgi:hypothetical protein
MSKKSSFWHHVRVVVMQLLVGLGLGVAIWELLGRWILSLKYGSIGSSVTCSADVERALTEFDSGLRISALVGALGFLALALLVRFLLWRRRQRVKTDAGKPGTGAGVEPDEEAPVRRTVR